MSTEDFPLLADPPAAIPLVYWILGCAGPHQWAGALGKANGGQLTPIAPNHSSEFAPDTKIALPTGVSAMLKAALAFLDPTA